MKHILVLGADVASADHRFGKLARIVVDNGVANQIVVNPSGLFSGPERVVPISDLQASTAETISLEATEAEWKAYGAYTMTINRLEQPGTGENMPLGVSGNSGELIEPPVINTSTTATTVGDTAVVLTHNTKVGDQGTFHGLVIDTGIPEAVIVGEQTIPFGEVSVLDSDHIQLGGKAAAPPTADQPTHLTNQP